MRYSDDEIETLDLDWFALDSNGFVAHFASAGKHIPESARSSNEDNTALNKYFRNDCPVSSQYTLSPYLNCFISLSGKLEYDRYLRNFRFMTIRGLFSFDTEAGKPLDLSYFSVTVPTVPKLINELPSNIAKLLKKTQFYGLFINTFVFNSTGIS